MNKPKSKLILGLVCALSLLVGCDTGQVAGIDRGGIDGGPYSAAVGPIAGFGSVFVNGVRYDTTGAEITIGGQPANEDNLSIGYVITIQADSPTDGSDPRALSIDFSYAVIGALESVDAVANRLRVLGQIIAVSDSTSYGDGIDPASIDGLDLLPMGQSIRLSGFRDTGGVLLATRVELGLPGEDHEVVGIVKDLDLGAMTFRIGDLIVDFQSSSVDGFAGGQLSEGDRVRVRGDQAAPAGVLIATEIELDEVELAAEDGDTLEIDGVVTNFISPARFNVSGVEVLTNTQTEFENGDASLLGPDVRVEVKGKFNASAILVAEEVEFEQEGNIRLDATVEGIDADAGTLILLGITVRASNSTFYEDKSQADLRSFNLRDIVPGDPLRVIGAESVTEPGIVIAIQLVRTEPLETFRLRGIASNFANPNFNILGLVIVTDSNTDIEDDFFATAEGTLVEVRGSFTGGIFIADKVETKD